MCQLMPAGLYVTLKVNFPNPEENLGWQGGGYKLLSNKRETKETNVMFALQKKKYMKVGGREDTKMYSVFLFCFHEYHCPRIFFQDCGLFQPNSL